MRAKANGRRCRSFWLVIVKSMMEIGIGNPDGSRRITQRVVMRLEAKVIAEKAIKLP